MLLYIYFFNFISNTMTQKITNAAWKSANGIYNRRATAEERTKFHQKYINKINMETKIYFLQRFLFIYKGKLALLFFATIGVVSCLKPFLATPNLGKGQTVKEQKRLHDEAVESDMGVEEVNEFADKPKKAERAQEFSFATYFDMSDDNAPKFAYTPYQCLVFEIKHGEGYSNQKYQDRKTRTVGFGTANTSGIATDETCTIVQANSYVTTEINILERELGPSLKSFGLDRWQYCMTLAIAYRTGGTLLRKTEFWQHLKRSDFVGASELIPTIHCSDDWTRARLWHIYHGFRKDFNKPFSYSYTGKSGEKYYIKTTFSKSVAEWKKELKQVYVDNANGKKVF